jgi:hypothetical protein
MTIPKILLLSAAFAVGRVASQTTTADIPVDLGGGIITRTDVKMYADLSLDVRDIRASTSVDQAIRIYREGLNSEKTAGFPLTLHSLGAERYAHAAPESVFYLYGLADLSTEPSDLEQHEEYAANFIEFAINQSVYAVAADAIVALSLWFYASHILYSGALICEEKTKADAPDFVNTGVNLPGGGMDEFIALWIGTGQTPGSEDGNGLYAWTERIGKLFGTATSESLVNTRLKILYEEGSVALSLVSACTKDNTRTTQLYYNVVVQMSKEMTIPLYQWLVYSMFNRDAPSAELYAKALIPRLSQCRPSQYTRLKELLLDDGMIDFADEQEILTILYSTLDCFGLTCRDIGTWSEDRGVPCDLNPVTNKLAGFSTSTDVTQVCCLRCVCVSNGRSERRNSQYFSPLLLPFLARTPGS